MVSGDFQELVGFGKFSFQVRYGLRVVVAVPEGVLNSGRTSKYVFRELSAFAQETPLLLVGLPESLMDSFVLDSKSIETLVAG